MARTRTPLKTPLTAEQRDRAAAYWPLAKKLAAGFSRQAPGRTDAYFSAASMGLIVAAAAWRPEVKSDFSKFARRVIVGRMIDVIRNGRRHESRFGRGLVGDECGPVQPDPLVAAEEPAAFERLVQSLPTAQAAVLRAYYRDGLSNPEQARRQGTTAAAIWGRHKRALTQLRKTLPRARP